jgi:hypothetical protein
MFPASAGTSVKVAMVEPFGCVPSIRMPGAEKDVELTKSALFWSCVRAVSDVRFRAGTSTSPLKTANGCPKATMLVGMPGSCVMTYRFCTVSPKTRMVTPIDPVFACPGLAKLLAMARTSVTPTTPRITYVITRARVPIESFVGT